MNKSFARGPLLLAFIIIGVMLSIGALYISLRGSLRDDDVQGAVYGLIQPVKVIMDQYGIPNIEAGSRLDGFRALGYVTANNRLFQMDLMRRHGAGRLAEIFGEAVIPVDKAQRVLGFTDVAKEIAHHLPKNQQEVLRAYADGVNSAIDYMPVLPFEFLLLGYQPERWRIEDSLLIALNMFQTLSNSEDEERMLTVMKRALPAEVYSFLTPMTDQYTQSLLGEGGLSDSDYAVPTEVIVSLLEAEHPVVAQTGFVKFGKLSAGSNAWAVAGTRTKDGRAILANDMHLDITVPTLWFRCRLKYENYEIAGVSLPGTPLIISGASQHLAWGMTALDADVLDLVMIQLNPEDDQQYLTVEGWKSFGVKHETIHVKGGAARNFVVKTTLWGPVAQKYLLHHPVAIRWTALDPVMINLGLLDIYEAQTLEQGVAIMNNTGGPPLNALLTDRNGRIAWTTLGRIPIRQGFDGLTSHTWANESIAWSNYISPNQLPRIIDPDSGVVINANNRSVSKHYPFVIGHAYANGYRAYRIAERLQAWDIVDEQKMFQLQLDTQVGIYGFYHDIALNVLNTDLLVSRPELQELRDYLINWNGKAESDSLGLAVLIEFRNELAKSLFEPLLSSCRIIDDEFEYSWTHMDIPLQALLREKNPQLLVKLTQQFYPDWNAFLLAILEQVTSTLLKQYSLQSLEQLTWGKVNRAHFVHPLSQGISGARFFLDFPEDALAGCDYCVKVNSPSFGATQRLVISPAHWQDGILHMPGGQSGHPLSNYYKNQHLQWISGQPIPFVSNNNVHKLMLVSAAKH